MVQRNVFAVGWARLPDPRFALLFRATTPVRLSLTRKRAQWFTFPGDGVVAPDDRQGINR